MTRVMLRMLKFDRWMGATLLAVICVASARAQTAPRPEITLQPHRIIYEISLGKRTGTQAISSARGLMALEFSGNACDGYATNFRQVVDLSDSDGGPRRMDFRVNLFEDGDGQRFRFTMHNRMQNRVVRDTDGEARRSADGSLAVSLKKPAGRKSDFDGEVKFPTALSIAMIEAAQKGQRSYQGKVFDGAEGGEKVFEVNASIGPALEGPRNDRLEQALRVPGLEGVARWPVSLAYYNDEPGDRVPVYTMRSISFANGVMGDIVFDFPEFSLSARATKYEPMKADSCTRR